MNKVVLGCDKETCVFSHICKKSIGRIYENKFECDEFRDLEMFLNELVSKNIEISK
jgi:hypothetical protein